MSQFDLQKKSDKIDDILKKKGVNKAPIMRVGAALDVSGSMEDVINRGHLQSALDQLMGAAMRFDDNGELDVWKFNTNCSYVGTCTPVSHDGYVNKKGIRAGGGTNYAPVVEETQKFFFGAQKTGFFGMGAKKADTSPALVLIITDGEPADREATRKMLKASSTNNIYFHFVGIGGTRSNFPTIAALADEFDNVGEVYLPRFNMSDDEVYEQLVCDELVQFCAKFATP